MNLRHALMAATAVVGLTIGSTFEASAQCTGKRKKTTTKIKRNGKTKVKTKGGLKKGNKSKKSSFNHKKRRFSDNGTESEEGFDFDDAVARYEDFSEEHETFDV